jgi:wyosine [tRNA(Phe)-imidazoG37] synthetase (radical SAM superfamily)
VEGALDGNLAFGCPRDFLGNRFVYAVVSPRARGLSLGINMNPDRVCNFACVYCEVNREAPVPALHLDIPAMIAELERALQITHSGALVTSPTFRHLHPQLLELRHVSLSGDGEPTLSPVFAQAVEAVVHLRSRRIVPFFKLVLITNTCGLDRPQVAEGLRLLTRRDEVWAKLEAGTQEYMDRVDRPDCRLERVLENILNLSRRRPVIIQSLFPQIRGEAPSTVEIEAYARNLRRLKESGAQIPLVQIYSATRPTSNAACEHLPLRTLSHIAQRVREVAGLNAEVF